jgi:hypothetical protein
MITLVQKLTQLEKRFISPCFAFAQIYKLQGYGQYNMHGSVINVPENVDQIQSILPHLSHDGAIIRVFLKRCLEYKSTYMSRNVCPNMVMVALRYLIETPLNKYLNVSIHHQWTSLFALHMNSKSQIPNYNNASSCNCDFDNEKIHYTLTYLVIDHFLDAPKIMDYENIYILLPQIKTFTL